MISISDAIQIVRTRVSPIGTESVHIGNCVGRVLAQDVLSDLDLPPFDRSQMDGFALRSADTAAAPVTLKIVGESAAGHGWDGVVDSGEAVRIMTGARVPTGADAVQQVELTEPGNSEVRVMKPAGRGKNIVPEGAEIRSGATVFSAGAIITRQMVASLAAFGYERVETGRKPRLAVLSTGSEIVDIGEEPGRDQIRNSNSSMTAALAADLADIEAFPIVKDDPEVLTRAIAEAAGRSDCVVISGGVSVGDYDFTKPALRDLGAEIHFEQLSLKPGKPTVFATLGDKKIFGLPGNPVSLAVTFLVFVRLALLEMQGASDPVLPKGRAVLSHDIRGTRGRDGMLPVKVRTDSEGRLEIESLKFSGSSNFVTFAGADALAFVPSDSGLKAGDVTDIYWI